MDSKIQRNRLCLTDLFAGASASHAIIMDPEPVATGMAGDFTIPNRPLSDWLSGTLESYERQLEWLDEIDDDSVPFVKLATGTGLFAAAFGCELHIFDDSPACAVPLVRTAEEADRLELPSLNAPTLARVFEFAEMIREKDGPNIPISVPDIQSPFDIAALIWNKEDLFVAMYEAPDAVKRLTDKCHALLKTFLSEFRRRFPEYNPCHCPNAWAPSELGCWLSEDEVGSMSVAMFEEFCLPYLVDLSETFGGMVMHCCAAADHQYGSFKKIPNLRGLNRVFQAPGPRPAIEAFSGQTALIVAWTDESEVHRMLDLALPETRFLINMPTQPLDEAKRTLERLRARCERPKHSYFAQR